MTNSTDFKCDPINVRLKLSALWVSVMCCYIYGDFFSLFVPHRLQDLMNGSSGVGSTTPFKLLMFAVLMTFPSIMIFLSLILKPKLNRWINISLGIFFTGIMVLIVATSFSEWRMFYTYLGIVEIVLTALIVKYAWQWPKKEV